MLSFLKGHSKSMFVEDWRGFIEKQTKMNRGREGPSICVHSLFKKKMLRFSKKSFIAILQFFLLIILAVWNIKQTIMKDYNIQPSKWMGYNCFCQPFLLCKIFCSFLCTVYYFLYASSAKVTFYSLVLNNVYFVINS